MSIASCTDDPQENTAVNNNEKSTKKNNIGTLSEEKISNTKMQIQVERIIESTESSDVIGVIVRVDTKDYVPDGIKPTVQINPYLFTARLQPGELQRLEKDKLVKSIEVSQNLQSNDDKQN